MRRSRSFDLRLGRLHWPSPSMDKNADQGKKIKGEKIPKGITSQLLLFLLQDVANWFAVSIFEHSKQFAKDFKFLLEIFAFQFS